jgi:uncharacterized protein (DUF488 family)
VRILTIGFTHSSAEHFFGRLIEARVRKVIDVRLRNDSQLSGFAKRDDLRYFLGTIARIDYEHRLDLAPSPALLTAIRQRRIGWPAYERRFIQLMISRGIAQVPKAAREEWHRVCLLCSEFTPDRCHRRLVAEHLRTHWKNIDIVHL